MRIEPPVRHLRKNKFLDLIFIFDFKGIEWTIQGARMIISKVTTKAACFIRRRLVNYPYIIFLIVQ